MSTPGMRDSHPEERLQDLLDGRLSPADAAAVRAHVDTCPKCRHVWRQLQGARDAAATLRQLPELPAGFEASLRSELNRLDLESPDARRVSSRLNRRALFAAAAAGLAGVAVVIWGRRRTRRDTFDHVFANHAEVVSGAVPLERQTTEAAELEAHFAAAGLDDIRVLDLAMMGFTLEGGRQASIAAQPAALYVYRGRSDVLLVCQMYRGNLLTLPPGDDIRRQGAFDFHVVTRGVTTAVFWQEGPIVCVLTSALPADEVFKLAVEKAMRPA